MVGNDEREQTLNQLLAELDGFDPSSGIVLLAATNRPEILDPALLRAGRFDRQILVDKPDKTGRVAILKVHTRKIHLGPDVDLEPVAAMTTGFTGADLANLVNEAAILATRRRADAVGMEDFSAAIERIVAGLEKRNRLLNEKERGIVAHHEMGHAIIALTLPGTDRVHKVSIIPRGVGALGYTIQRPTEDRYLMTREELVNKICVLLGGRAAEKLVSMKSRRVPRMISPRPPTLPEAWSNGSVWTRRLAPWSFRKTALCSSIIRQSGHDPSARPLPNAWTQLRPTSSGTLSSAPRHPFG